MANAIAVLDAARARDDVPESAIPDVVGRISFFLNAGIRFVEEICKARAMAELWDEITAERYGVADPVLGLVGKGITFDTGGISIKPADGMERMKDDMAGGAAVACAMRAIALLEAPMRVLGVVPATENMPGGRAIKPGDILTSASCYRDIMDGLRRASEVDAMLAVKEVEDPYRGAAVYADAEGKVTRIVAGGPTRSESSRIALDLVGQDDCGILFQ